MAETTAAMGLRPLSKLRAKGKQRTRPSTRYTRRKVLKMLAVMEQQRTPDEPSNSHSQEFLTSGRTGRRNALPDILSEHAVVSSADLPARLQLLSTTDPAAGPSGQREKPDVAGPSGAKVASPNGGS